MSSARSHAEPPHLRDQPAWLQQAVRPELLPGERLVWLGRPQSPRHRLQRRLLAVNVLIAMCLAIHLIPPPWFDLWETFFAGQPPVGRYVVLACLLGLVVLLAVTGVRSRRADARTWYALTDRRVIVTEPRPLRRLAFDRRLLDLWSYDPGQLGAMACDEEDDGSGDLILEEYQARDSEGEAYPATSGIMNVRDVRHIEQLIRDTLLAIEK